MLFVVREKLISTFPRLVPDKMSFEEYTKGLRAAAADFLVRLDYYHDVVYPKGGGYVKVGDDDDDGKQDVLLYYRLVLSREEEPRVHVIDETMRLQMPTGIAFFDACSPEMLVCPTKKAAFEAAVLAYLETHPWIR